MTASKKGGACNKPPKLSLTVPNLATAGATVEIVGSVQPGTGQPGCAIVAWSLDFGDGAALGGTSAGTINARHVYPTAARYTLELMAESDSGPSATPIQARLRVTEATVPIEPPIIEPPPVIEPPIEPIEPPIEPEGPTSEWLMSSTEILCSDTVCLWSAY